jgi:4'-phosphopantetheinyl transferase
LQKYCTGARRTGIVARTVIDTGQAWQPQGLDDLSRDRGSPVDHAVELWYADLAEFTSLLSAPLDAALLSEAERDRAARMAAAPVREHFLLSRILLRRLLGVRLGVAPGELRLGVTTHGKPCLECAGGQSTTFNLSHCRGAWLLGIAHGMPIGVDIERPRHVDTALRLAARVFTTTERDELMAAAPDGVDCRDSRFLRCWTRKEALLKAAGSGFTWPASEFEVSTERQFRKVPLPRLDGRSALVWSVELPVTGFAACAVIGEGHGSTEVVPETRLRWLRLRSR